MKKRFLFLPILILLLFAGNGTAQVYNYADGEGPTPPDSVKGLYVGLNLGVYFANKNTARIYDGSGYERNGEIINKVSNTRDTWLYQALFGTPQAQDRLENAMNPDDYDKTGEEFSYTDFPQLMTYRGSFLFGGHLRYMLNSDFGAFVEVNGTFPVTVGQFTIQTNSTGTQPGQNDRVRKFGIRGEEQRFMVNFGIHKVLGRKAAEKKGKTPSILPYLDLGGSVTFTKFEANVINLEDQSGYFNETVDITRFYNRTGTLQQEANVLTGAGFGGFAAVGMQITIGRKFTIDLGYVANLQNIKLGEMSETGFQHQVVLKAIYM